MANICVNCAHHRNSAGPDVAGGIWHQYTCRHKSSCTERRDYTTGMTVVDWGYCRDRNPDGECSDYEAK